jgi:hypothetical protein
MSFLGTKALASQCKSAWKCNPVSTWNATISASVAFCGILWPIYFKTRCRPRTRMLTRMFMVQMSKHTDMQSRRTVFCNSLFEQSCTYFPCCQSAVWSGKCRVWSVECEVRSVKCGVWSVECGECRVVSVECGVCSVECRVNSVECLVYSVEWRVYSV